MSGVRTPRFAAAVVFAGLLGCSSSGDDAIVRPPDRAPGDRSPLTAPCDSMDDLRCLLPWPSSTFTARDPKTSTGIRLAIVKSSVQPGDDPKSLNAANGFSRVTPLVTGFATKLAPLPSGATGPVRLFVAQADDPRFGEEVPLRIVSEDHLTDDGAPESLLFAYPRSPLLPGADYVAIVTSDVKAEGGAALPVARAAQVALALVEPASNDEGALVAYHAPTRATLAKAGVDPATVLRVWDFTTRSADDPTKRLTAMRLAMQGKVTAADVTIDKVEVPSPGPIAAIVEGRVTGLPSYAVGAGLTLDDEGMAVASGTRDAPFRVVLPAGTGDFHFVMYGHGTGGDFHDATFDAQIAELGAAKVGIQFDGWTGDTLPDTFVGLAHAIKGTHKSAAFLMQAIADATAIQSALAGPLGDALAAATIGGLANPVAGRHPDSSLPIWTGGSLGGTMGLVYACVNPDVHHGVLNVPGAAWTHFVPTATPLKMLRPLIRNDYGGDFDLDRTIAITQTNWDDVDGAVWAIDLADKHQIFLEQESIGDPVLPNPGSEMVAVTTGALAVGAVLTPIGGVNASTGPVVGKTALTQYHVSGTDPLDIHGFAAKDTPAGIAARAQIKSFLESVWAGTPTIDVPSGCTAGSCDFSE